MKAFLLNFSDTLTQPYVHNVLNSSNSIDNWVSPFPNSVLVISRLTCAELAAVLHSHFGENLFILVEASSANITGWLPEEFWNFVNNPQASWARFFQSQTALPKLPGS